jgi:hypothetical protein
MGVALARRSRAGWEEEVRPFSWLHGHAEELEDEEWDEEEWDEEEDWDEEWDEDEDWDDEEWDEDEDWEEEEEAEGRARRGRRARDLD